MAKVFSGIRRAWRDFWSGVRGYDVRPCPWCKRDLLLRDDTKMHVLTVHMEPMCPDWTKMYQSGDPSTYLRAALARGEIQPYDGG